MSTSFKLPKFGPDYTERITQRCENLIRYHIWEGFDLTMLRQWLLNFQSDEARYFSACLLDALIYRSESQTCALAQQLFQRSLPDLVRTDPPPTVITADWLGLLASSTDPLVRVIPVVKDSDPPTKSGFLVSRLLKRELRINANWIINPDDLATHANSAEVLLFVDDFLGTGDQFGEFFANFERYVTSHYVVYAPLAAHEEGVDALRSDFPNLRVTCVEPLRSSNNVFHPSSSCFDDGINTPTVAQEFQASLFNEFGIPIEPEDSSAMGVSD